jgi:hypothetical protein
MVSFGRNLRYYVYEGWVDMRMSFVGLGRTGLESDVYIFLNRRRTQVKMLVWGTSGLRTLSAIV